MTLRFVASFLVVSAVLIASPAVLRGMATDGPAARAASQPAPQDANIAGRTSAAGLQSSPMTLAAASAEFLACKQGCEKKYDCGAVRGRDPGRDQCIERKKACIQACK